MATVCHICGNDILGSTECITCYTNFQKLLFNFAIATMHLNESATTQSDNYHIYTEKLGEYTQARSDILNHYRKVINQCLKT